MGTLEIMTVQESDVVEYPKSFEESLEQAVKCFNYGSFSRKELFIRRDELSLEEAYTDPLCREVIDFLKKFKHLNYLSIILTGIFDVYHLLNPSIQGKYKDGVPSKKRNLSTKKQDLVKLSLIEMISSCAKSIGNMRTALKPFNEKEIKVLLYHIVRIDRFYSTDNFSIPSFYIEGGRCPYSSLEDRLVYIDIPIQTGENFDGELEYVPVRFDILGSELDYPYTNVWPNGQEVLIIPKRLFKISPGKSPLDLLSDKLQRAILGIPSTAKVQSYNSGPTSTTGGLPIYRKKSTSSKKQHSR